MGYLICENCAGYYELKEEEHPEDYETCICGGNLEYVEELSNLRFRDKLLLRLNIKRIAGILVGGVIMLLSFYIFSPDPYSSNFVYNNNISFFIWFAGGVAAALISGGNIKSGAANGFYSATFSGLIVIIFNFLMVNNYFNNPSMSDNIAFFAALCAIYILVPAIFSIIGGLLAVLVRKILTKFV
jgi:hypothetical protein